MSPETLVNTARHVWLRLCSPVSSQHFVLEHQPLRAATRLQRLFERELGQSDEILTGNCRQFCVSDDASGAHSAQSYGSVVEAGQERANLGRCVAACMCVCRRPHALVTKRRHRDVRDPAPARLLHASARDRPSPRPRAPSNPHSGAAAAARRPGAPPAWDAASFPPRAFRAVPIRAVRGRAA